MASSTDNDTERTFPIGRVIILGVLGVILVLGIVGLTILVKGSARREALKLVREHRFRDAEPSLKAALADYPEDVDLIKGMAMVKENHEQWDEAIDYLSEWCTLRPNSSDAFKRRMMAYEAKRNFPAALADGVRAQELQPGDPEVAAHLAPLYLVTGRIEECEKQARRILALDPKNPGSLFVLADACHQQGKNAEAATALDAILADSQNSSPDMLRKVLLLRGTIFIEDDAPKQAVELLARAANLEENKASQQMAILYQLALALSRLGQKSEAEEIMSKAMLAQAEDLVSRKEHPKVAALKLRVAEAIVDTGDVENSVKLLATVSRDDPTCTSEAIRILKKAVAKDPRSAAARNLLANYAGKEGAKDQQPQLQP
jgi:tetratricopeptide (TPR) repeat protein